MKFAAILFAALTLVASTAIAQSVDSTGLKIHIFDVGQAMSQLIVFPSGYSVLLDCPELNWNSGATAQKVSGKLYSILGKYHIDVAVATHLHLDHVGYAGYGGMWALLEKYGWTFGKFIERDAGTWKDTNGDGKCTEDEITWHNVGTTSGTGSAWICYGHDPANTRIYPILEQAKLCSKTQIKPTDADTEVMVVTTDALGVKTSSGKAVSGDHRSDTHPPSENDYSIGFIFRYKVFSYGFFSDLDGEYSISSYGYSYNDEETVVAKRVPKVDLYNVNHHGSEHSSNPTFLAALDPTASIISCGLNNSHGHPKQITLDKLLPISDVWITEKGNPSASYGKSRITNGDITITTTADGKSFTVSGGGMSATYTSRKSTLPACKL